MQNIHANLGCFVSGNSSSGGRGRFTCGLGMFERGEVTELIAPLTAVPAL